MNLLVIGSDSRKGDNAALFGHEDGLNNDTTFLVHIPEHRQWMEVISFPRDMIVDIPVCRRTDGSMTAPVRGAMFNVAMSRGAGASWDMDGAAACVIATVEQITGVRVTDHAVVEMTGVIDIVDALGGVPIDLPEAVRGNHHVDLDLPAGPQVLDGWQSINFIRARGGSGMGLHLGSDLARIERQHHFLDALISDLVERSIWTDSAALYRASSAALRAMTLNPSLGSAQSLTSLAWTFRGFDTDSVVFTELPVGPYPDDHNRVVALPAAEDIWARWRAGEAPPCLAERMAEATGMDE